MFNTIGLISKPNDFTSEKTILKLAEFLNNIAIKTVYDVEKIRSKADLIIVVGGDGSLLSTAREFINDSIPILGVNLGRLGFLVDVLPQDMYDVIEEVLNKEFVKEKRNLLSCQVFDSDDELITKHCAFNDVVVHKQESLRMIEFEVYIDDKFVNSQHSDGLIVSTPTGSTAYALSSGGPIMHPELDSVVLVSICPHTLSNRPLVVSAQSKINIYVNETMGATVSLDGQIEVVLKPGQYLTISEHENYVQLLHPKNYDYFNVIRSKLHWGGKL